MITLTGIAKFPLDAYFGFNSRVMTVDITVQCDVVCGWDREAGAADMISLKPVLVTTIVGGVDMGEEKYSDLSGALKSFVGLQCEKLGLEGVGITDAQVRDALANVEDWRAHEREHAVGKV